MDALIKKDIEEDFESCVAGMYNAEILMDNVKKFDKKKFESNYLKNIDFSKISEKQKSELLVTLGRVCELAFKYLLKVTHIQIYPNHTYEQFSKNQQIFKASSINDLANKGFISSTDADEINNFVDDNKTKFHNYTYLSLVLEKVSPVTYYNLKKYFEYSYCSALALEKYKDVENSHMNDSLKKHYLISVIFPYVNLGIYSPDIMQKIEEFKLEMKNVQEKSGDIFTKLRYFSNNVNNEQFNLDTIFIYTYILVSFIINVYNEQNDLLIDSEYAFGRMMACENSKLIKRKIDEINYIYDKYKDEDTAILAHRIISKYSINEMEEIDKKCSELGLDMNAIYLFDITIEDQIFFHNLGWNNIIAMHEYLYDFYGRRRTYNQVIALINRLKNAGITKEELDYFFNSGTYDVEFILYHMLDENGRKRTFDEVKANYENDGYTSKPTM